MDDVTMGGGGLAGRGVYAGRDFDAGKIVVRYELQPLTIEEYEALPAREEIFVHSYGGCRYLRIPAPTTTKAPVCKERRAGQLLAERLRHRLLFKGVSYLPMRQDCDVRLRHTELRSEIE